MFPYKSLFEICRPLNNIIGLQKTEVLSYFCVICRLLIHTLISSVIFYQFIHSKCQLYKAIVSENWSIVPLTLSALGFLAF